MNPLQDLYQAPAVTAVTDVAVSLLEAAADLHLLTRRGCRERASVKRSGLDPACVKHCSTPALYP